ncbi:MAG: DUF4349 domain-containing protein [Dehalococcoidia bacterium]|nr:DUF4349 domain-containing protein [Dehalococcoidia bacterium]
MRHACPVIGLLPCRWRGPMAPTSFWRLWILLSVLVIAFVALVACGDDDDDDDSAYYEAAAATQAAAAREEPARETQAAAAEEAPAQEAAAAAAETTDDGGDGAGDRMVSTAAIAQSRIIVHTAQMSLVVNDVARATADVRAIAARLGGWIVSSDQTARHSGSIAIRVPARSLNRAFSELESVASEVESLQVSSRDVTEEFVDSESRLNSLRATEQRLLSFLDKAETVEEALLVQEELSALQLQIESIQGRLNYLREVAAFSLIEVELKLAAVTIDVDAGPGASYRVGQPVRFQASFTAPPGVDEYSFEWDFGDGSRARGRGSVLTPDGTRVTATVTHSYSSDLDSPYIVTLQLTGAGEGGRAEGTDSLLIEVKRVPAIEVFAGDPRTVEEGHSSKYAASFTRPSELWDYEYQWDWGDGSPSTIGNPEEGATRVEVSHRFSDHRPRPYEVTFTVSAMSDAGRVSSSQRFTVTVTEGEDLVVGGWNLDSTARGAVYALSAVGRVVLTVLIWLGIFVLPIGAAILIVAYPVRRGWPRVSAFFSKAFSGTGPRPPRPRARFRPRGAPVPFLARQGAPPPPPEPADAGDESAIGEPEAGSPDTGETAGSDDEPETRP